MSKSGCISRWKLISDDAKTLEKQSTPIAASETVASAIHDDGNFSYEVSRKLSSESSISQDEEVKNNWINELENFESDLINSVQKNTDFRNEVRMWATTFNIRHTALKGIISIINKRWPKTLPQDPRTLLKTPQETITWKVGEGEYWHQSFRACIENNFADISEPKNIIVNINIDGLPTYKSSKDEFWPILFNIHGMPNLKPMIIGIYCGKGKPTDLNAFLSPFVQEMKQVLENGIFVNGFKITIKIRCFICDSPARAFVKGVCNFNGQHGCQKCTTVGEYSYISHCNFYPRSNCQKRTNASFRSKLDEAHHKKDSPLLDLPIDMVQDFVVADSLHLLDLGIMKRCLLGWRDGSLGTFRTKWSLKDTTNITAFLLQCKMPAEIHRAVRGLDCLAYWKGLEYRTFLYYIAIVILRYHLPSDVYQHFLTFFCAVTICSSDEYRGCLDLAHILLEHYVELYGDIYGECYITSNVHNLTHLVDDVKRFGVLNSISAYPFESKLYQIKNLIRTGNKPLVQVAKRLGEFGCHDADSSIQSALKLPVLSNQVDINQIDLKVSKELFCSTEQTQQYFSSVQLNNFLLNTKMENRWFLTKNNEIVAMKYAVKINTGLIIFGNKLENIRNFFETPIKSRYLNIYISDCKQSTTSGTYKISDIKCKLVAVQDIYSNTVVFIPLLHTVV